MYYVNREEIDRRLTFIEMISDTASQLADARGRADIVGGNGSVLRFAEERAVHLAAECVTDIGSYLIDGFVMRDAGSYEDIVDILHGEHVFGDELYPFLQSLVKLRKPLVQEFDLVDSEEVIRLTALLAAELPKFVEAVRIYLETELGSFQGYEKNFS